MEYRKNITSPIIIVRGAGEMASAIAHRLYKVGFIVAMTEISHPTVIRRTVSFATAMFDGMAIVEGVIGKKQDIVNIQEEWDSSEIPIILDPQANSIGIIRPHVVVDAILAKKNTGTYIEMASLVIGVGPGFCAQKDCHYVIETMRGHDLGRILESGSSMPDTGIPGEIAGFGKERVLRSPTSGVFTAHKHIGDSVLAHDVVASVGKHEIYASISGVLRGILHDGILCYEGQKVGDIDPRNERQYCFTISDKARAIAGSVLEIIVRHCCISFLRKDDHAYKPIS